VNLTASFFLPSDRCETVHDRRHHWVERLATADAKRSRPPSSEWACHDIPRPSLDRVAANEAFAERVKKAGQAARFAIASRNDSLTHYALEDPRGFLIDKISHRDRSSPKCHEIDR